MNQDSTLSSVGTAWPALAASLLDFEAHPGRYPLAAREPRLLFDHGTEVLSLASGRAVRGLPQDDALLAQLRKAARFFVRTAMLRPGADHYTLMGLTMAFEPGADPFQVAAFTMLAALMALVVVEHWFLVLPMSPAAMWSWGLASRSEDDGSPAVATKFAEPAPIARRAPALRQKLGIKTS